MVGGVGDALGKMFMGMLISLIIFVPLGMWKLVEIIVWLVKHVHIG